jgi:hypothetical protein
MARKKAEAEDAAEEMTTTKVRRELTEDELDERRDQFINKTFEVQDLRVRRTMANQKVNLKIKGLDDEIRTLGQEIRDGAQWVDAQMTLEDAAKARKAVVRQVQPPAP